MEDLIALNAPPLDYHSTSTDWKLCEYKMSDNGSDCLRLA